MFFSMILMLLFFVYAALGFLGSLSVLVRAAMTWKTSMLVRFCLGVVTVGCGCAYLYFVLIQPAHTRAEMRWPMTLLVLSAAIIAPTLWWIATALCWLDYLNGVVTRDFTSIPNAPMDARNER